MGAVPEEGEVARYLGALPAPRVQAPEAWGQFVISSVAQRGLDPLLEALWTHAAQVLKEETAGDEEEEPWRP